MKSSPATVLVFVTFVACHVTDEPSQEPQPAPQKGAQRQSETPQLPSPAVPLNGPSVVTSSTDRKLSVLGSQKVVAARVISKRTLSLKLWFEGGQKAVFKPMKKRDSRPLHEVAAFRLAEFLKIDGVPCSTMRALPLHQLVRLIRSQYPDQAALLQKRAVLNDKGAVSGAVIEWVEGLDPGRLKTLGGQGALMRWLAVDRPKGREPRIAAKVSAMVVFDYLIGNWDRFSGGNIFLQTNNEELILIDHNSTFAPWSDRQSERMSNMLGRTDRFPAGLMEQVTALTHEDVEAALSKESWHREQAVLSPSEVNLLFARRDQLLSHVDRLTKRHGREAVLFFP